MELEEKKIPQSLNKAFLKQRPELREIERFQYQLSQMCSKVNADDSEENFKFAILEFLNEIGYKNRYAINSKSKIDLVIRKDNKPESPVSVLIEVKSLKNNSEMISLANPNKKAFHELILYYLREKYENNTTQIRHLIITNLFEWFIFDAREFENILDKDLQKNSKQFLEDELSIHKTEQFYREVASPYLKKKTETLNVTYFKLEQNNLNQVQLSQEVPKNNLNQLIHLYKIFSPEHLLQLPFANDSNTLDKRFYIELLHIIGIEEVTKGGKKLIQRPPKKRRHIASLLEDTIIQLESLDKLSVLKDPKQYGVDEEEQIYNVALELCVTWINRLLFLKLLEAQLSSFHPNDKKYRFVNKEIIDDYDDVNTLFFQVLAVKLSKRNEDVRDRFNYLPYLNSTLFSPTELEQSTIFISNLSNDKKLQLHGSTVLKDRKGKRRKGEMETLSYLFQFLDAYDFSSQGSEEVHKEHKTLISPAVLGLIFEKINGYKEGSFYTPGYITMFLARETIRKSLLQKFNQKKGWNCQDLNELRNNITKNTDSLVEANEIINSLKVCDPAVGSGHFLVSALNEIIYLKHDLGILMDSKRRLLKNYDISLENDDLMITDPSQDGDFFQYNPKSKESQRVQKTLFQEKKTIIENCLFGVDINPNSVNICRLRLWIELLKYTFYKADGQLETLPNIDINIKCGNSLLSRYSLGDTLEQIDQKHPKVRMGSYKKAVRAYKETNDWREKHKVTRLIEELKNAFQMGLDDRIQKKYAKTVAKLKEEEHRHIFLRASEMKITLQDKERIKDLRKQEQEVRLEKEADLALSDFHNAFEWRFEFPEVLDRDGQYIGFDVVIGNPPYMRIQEISKTQIKEKKHYENAYDVATRSYDMANLFFERALQIGNQNMHGAFIFPHKFLNSENAHVFRKSLMRFQSIQKISHFGANKIFEDADTYTCLVQFTRSKNEALSFQRFPPRSDFRRLMLDDWRYTEITYKEIEEVSKLYGNNQWILFNHSEDLGVFRKIYSDSKPLKNVLKWIFVGLSTSLDELYILKLLNRKKFELKVPLSGETYRLEPDLFKPLLFGKEVERYRSSSSLDNYVFFPYEVSVKGADIIPLDVIEVKYPKTFKYIMDHQKNFKNRERGKLSKEKNWHAFIYPKNLEKFEQHKIVSMEICTKSTKAMLDHRNYYHTTTVRSWVKHEHTSEPYEYLLAIANSKLFWWFMFWTSDTLRGNARRLMTKYIKPFPIPSKIDKKLERSICNEVQATIEIKRNNPLADTTDQEKKIDRLIFQAYNLTDEEIKIVERRN